MSFLSSSDTTLWIYEEDGTLATAEHINYMAYKEGLSEMDIDMLHFRVTKTAIERQAFAKTGSDDSSSSYLIHEEVAGLQVI